MECLAKTKRQFYRIILLTLVLLVSKSGSSFIYTDSGLLYAADQDEQLKDLVGFWYAPFPGSSWVKMVFTLALSPGGFTLTFSHVDQGTDSGWSLLGQPKFEVQINGRDLTGVVKFKQFFNEVHKCTNPPTTTTITGRISPDWKTIVIISKGREGLCGLPPPPEEYEVVYQFKPYNR